MNLSFTNDQGMIILNHLSAIFPAGVDMFVYSKNREGSIIKCEYKNEKKSTTEFTDDSPLQSIYDIRKPRKNRYSWELDNEFRESNLSEKNNTYQFQIGDESKHSVLSMRFNSPYDSLDDVVFLRFREELSFLGIEGSEVKFATSIKAVFANILHRSVQSVITSAKSDFNFYGLLSEQFKLSINKTSLKSNELLVYKENFQKAVSDISDNIRKEYSDKYNKDFIFTDESLNELEKYSGHISKLEPILRNAAEFAYYINISTDNKIIPIESHYLDFSVNDIIPDMPANQNEKITKENQEQRIFNRLRDIENAVKKLKANNININGINVGKTIMPAISAAAITDFLKKHADEINILLEKFPELFTLSRTEFKPLANVIRHKYKAS